VAAHLPTPPGARRPHLTTRSHGQKPATDGTPTRPHRQTRRGRNADALEPIGAAPDSSRDNDRTRTRETPWHTPRPELTYNLVVVDQLDAQQADQVFHALSDATRRDILARLSRHEQSVSALARHYPISLTAVQKHVGVLENAGLVTKRRRGRESLVSSRTDPLRGARLLLDSLEDLWRERLDRFGEVLADTTERTEP
jgi:DNA-binding transcriptional ArsR family regulator